MQPPRLNALVSTLLLAASLCASSEPNPDRTQEPGTLSHAALFAPNTTFPYFENCGALHAENPRAYDARNAAILAQVSLLAYVKEPDFIREALAKAGFVDSEFFEAEGTYAFLAESEHHIVIAFRGTETANREDYLTDAKFAQRAFTEFGRAHAGFLDALDCVAADIETALDKRLESSDKTIWLTGHSLGAALATLFSIQNPDYVDALYVIGSPRAVNRKLAAHCHESLPIFRIVNNNDLIARMPGPPFYQHIGSTYFITPDRELLIDPPLTRLWRERLKGHGQLTKTLLQEHWSKRDFSAIPVDYFVDHSPVLYAKFLIEQAQAD